MGVNNRKRRAAKQRKQAREQGRAHEPGGGRQREDEDWGAEAAFHVVEGKVHAALRRLGAKRPSDTDLAHAARSLVAGAAPCPRHLVEIVLGDLVGRVVHAVAAGGWSPADLAELVGRNLGRAHLPAFAAALREDGCHHDRGQAWRDAVDRIEPDSTLRLSAGDSLASALGLLALLNHVPRLTDAIAATGRDAGPEHPKLARVRALLAKAESTEYDEEAEALSAKAQELISRYALDRLVDEGPAADRGDLQVRRLWLDAPYVGAKTALVAAVASANRCRSASAERWGFSVVIGAPADLHAVELLVTSLLVQADAAMLRHGRRSDSRGTTRTRSFRQSFLTAYAARIGQRLAAVTAAAARAGGDDLLPVLRSQELKVAEEFDRLVPHTVGRAASVSNGEGWAAGVAAADLAMIDVNGRLGKAG